MMLYMGKCALKSSDFMVIKHHQNPGLDTNLLGRMALIGGIMSITITLPIIGILEKANVRRIKSA